MADHATFKNFTIHDCISDPVSREAVIFPDHWKTEIPIAPFVQRAVVPAIIRKPDLGTPPES